MCHTVTNTLAFSGAGLFAVLKSFIAQVVLCGLPIFFIDEMRASNIFLATTAKLIELWAVVKNDACKNGTGHFTQQLLSVLLYLTLSNLDRSKVPLY
jgi:hypothetical protein